MFGPAEDLGLEDDPPRVGPTAGFVPRLAGQPDLGPALRRALGLRLGQQGRRDSFQGGVGNQPNRVLDALAFAPRVEPGDSEPAVGTELDRDRGPRGTQAAQQAAEDQDDEAAAMHVPRAQDGGDDLAGIRVEDQQGMIHVLAIVALVGDPLLLPMGGVGGPIEVQSHPRGRARLPPFAQVDRDQRLGERFHRAAVHRILQAREGGLTGQVGATRREPPAHQLEQRVTPQGVGVILVGVAAGDLEHPLADQRLQRVVDRAAAPLGDAGRERGADAHGTLGHGQPGQPPIAGQPTGIEARCERNARRRVEGVAGAHDGHRGNRDGTLTHRSTVRGKSRSIPYTRRCFSLARSGPPAHPGE